MKRKQLTIYLAIVFLLGFVGCAHMTQFQMAKRISLVSYNALALAKAEIQDMQQSTLPEVQKAAEKAVPIYNNAYDLLKEYNQMLLKWQKTGKKPSNIELISQEFNLLLTKLNKIILKHIGGQNV